MEENESVPWEGLTEFGQAQLPHHTSDWPKFAQTFLLNILSSTLSLSPKHPPG
jgi:hypothetical protein